MSSERVRALESMLARNPADVRARFGLALEYEKLEQWREAADQLNAYLEQTDDEGNAWGRLANALHRLGEDEDAMAAYRRGIDAANRHGHPSMAFELGEALAELERAAD